MQGPGGHILARPGLTRDQQRRVRWRDALEDRVDLTHLEARADQLTGNSSWSEIGTTELPSIESIRNTLRPTRTAAPGCTSPSRTLTPST